MTRKTSVWSEEARAAVRAALVRCGQRYDQTPAICVDARTMFAPPAHEVALAFDRPLVVGGRGTGKSYWAAALCRPEARDRLMSLYPRARRSLQATRSFHGFAGRLGVETSPFAATAGELLELVDRAPRDHAWRAVLCRYVANRPDAALAEMYDSGTTRDRAFRDRIVEIGGGTPDRAAALKPRAAKITRMRAAPARNASDPCRLRRLGRRRDQRERLVQEPPQAWSPWQPEEFTRHAPPGRSHPARPDRNGRETGAGPALPPLHPPRSWTPPDGG